MADIFVSYDNRDSELARRLGDALRALGHSAHLYEDEVRPGESFVKWMRQRLGKDQLFACVYTSSYLTSPYTQFEFDTALSETLTAPGFLLVFRFEDCEVTKVARQFSRCDLFGVSDEADFRARIARYLRSASALPAAISAAPDAGEEPRSATEKRPISPRVGIAEGLAAFAGLATVWGALQSDLPVAARWSAFAALAILLLFGVHFYAVLHGAGEPRGSREWREFGKLRASLVRGGAFEVVYAGFLTRALDALDHFLGDPPADVAGTKPTVAECWSAAAYDRCLSLALIYPLVTMFAVWVASGDVGDAERAIGLALSPANKIGGRIFSLATIAVLLLASFRLFRTTRIKSRLFWGTVFFAPFAIDIAFHAFFDRGMVSGFHFVTDIAAALTFASALRSDFAGALAFTGALTFAFASANFNGPGWNLHDAIPLIAAVAPGISRLHAFVVAEEIANDVHIAIAGAVAVAVAVAVATLLEWLRGKGRLGKDLVVFAFTVTAFVACLLGARYLSKSRFWDRSGALLVFFGLLTLVNAPFDCAAIGLTRFLLRYGLALKGWWPIALALVDAATAAVSVALLAIACVLAVQLFGDIAAHFGGGEKARIIHLAQVFDSLAEAPTASENLWIWFMLFSTAIPSVVNLFIACGAALRALPFVNRWLLAELLEGADMSEPAKIRVALVLAGQWALGALATFWLVYGLFIVVGPLVGPAYAQWLLDLSRTVARCNWPARAIIWATGGGWQGCM